MKLALTGLRVLVGALFIGHGTQKLFGWFGGYGLDATGDAFDSMGLKPGKHNAAVAGLSEAGGGALLAAGLATPVAGAALTGTMIQAIRTVHGPKGPWVTDGGWEYNAILIAIALTIVEHGPGPISFDNALGLKLYGPGWALAALVVGAAGPTIVSKILEAAVPDSAADTVDATATDATAGEAASA